MHLSISDILILLTYLSDVHILLTFISDILILLTFLSDILEIYSSSTYGTYFLDIYILFRYS